MSIAAGRDLILKLGDGAESESFAPVAGLRTRSLSLNARTVDVTHADSPGGWRELLTGVGLKTCTVSGAGVFIDDAAASRIRQLFFDQQAASWQVVLPGAGRIEGAFLVAALDYSGRFDGEAAWSLSLASAGALVFIPS